MRTRRTEPFEATMSVQDRNTCTLSTILILLCLSSFHLVCSWQVVPTFTAMSRHRHFPFRCTRKAGYAALVSSFCSTTIETETTNTIAGDLEARSQFGCKDYWDDMYDGRGDFPSDEYSWYYGWDKIKPHFQNVPKTSRILIPGVGNDPLLLDLVGSGYADLTAFDYSANAVERQHDLLSYCSPADQNKVKLHTMDARHLPDNWSIEFDAVLEKGALDAMYLAGDGIVEMAAQEFLRVLRPGGRLTSISGVVPDSIRRQIFTDESWEWLRDGSDDLQAGCFVFRKR